MAGLSQKQKLEFGHSAADQAKNYHFLDRNKNVNISDPPTDLSEICSALRTLLFKETEIDSILRILSAILHLGNLRFDVISTGDGIERVKVDDRKNIGRICTILKLDESNLLCALTTKRTLLKNGESFAATANLDVRGALDARDCIVRECYSKLVGQIVAKANGTLGGRRKEVLHISKGDFLWLDTANHGGNGVAIGARVLSVFCDNRSPVGERRILLMDDDGKKIEVNSADLYRNFNARSMHPTSIQQLCINYTSECLQQFFIRRIFKFEQSEYEAQGLPGWAFGSIGFSDNWPILDMLAVNSLSLMAVIDDASCAPNATDDEALERLHNAQQRNGQRFFLSPKSRLCAQFVVCHYTGQVAYRVKGMLAKNRNQFAHQLRLLFLGSQLKFVQRLFELPAQNGGNEWMTENEGTFAQLRQQTLANCCRLKMDALMGRLEHCATAYFVRCIRPNDSAGGEKHFDRAAVLRQMRQLDLLAVVEQCLAGFSAKFEFANFVSRYRILVPNSFALQKCHCVQETRAICQQIFEANGFNVPPVAFGKTKIFLKAEGYLMLEQLRKERLQRCAVLVQKYLRGWAQFRQFERLRWAAIVFQKNWRTFAQLRNYQKLIRGFTRLQSLVRAHHSVLRFRQLHANIVQLQAHCRAALLRHQLYSQRTREDRRCAMNLRLEEGQKVAAEPPALFLHAVEFEAGRDCVKNLCGGICVRFDGPMLAQLEGKSWSVDVELANFGWEKFMLAYFQNFSMFHNNCRRPILRALLPQKCEMDEICATAIWCRVQELMGNAFGQKKIKLKSKDKVPIMLRLSAMFGKNYSSAALKQLKYAVLQMEDEAPSLLDNILICCGEESALDKIQLISFSPSAQLWPYLLNFVLRFAPTRHIFCRIERSLTRIRRFGARKEPPIEAELLSSIFGDSQIAHESDCADAVAIDLAYRQIVHGIHSMEYPCEKEEDLVTLTAQQHFIDIHGNCEIDVKFLEEQLEQMLPNGTLNKKQNDEENIEIERQRWVQLIMHTFRKKIVKDGIAPSVEFVKCQVIEFARIHWPIIFSRFFYLNKFSGPHLPCNQISLAVNSEGLILFDPPRQNKFAEFAFAQISAVSHSHSKRAGAQSICVQLLNGDRFTFQSPRSPELALLINQILHQLRLKSLYAVALKNSSAENAFEYARGDLLILNMPFGEQTPNDWITVFINYLSFLVENAHIGMHGKIALNAVHILTTAVMPTAEELGSLLTPSSHEVEEHFDFGQRMRHPPPHNLEKFAADNFRKAELFNAFAGRSEDSSIYSFCGSVEGHSDLWRHSPKPLKAPLLKRLNAGGRDEIVQQSICSYSHILMYMFDQQPMLAPASPQHSPLEHTDAIFEAPLKHEILRDETYCQLMKQLTLNPNAISEERGWELMWLCLGLFSPSAGLLSELSLFLRSRPYPMAVDCAGRLEKTIGNVRPFSFRQCPPHQVEVEAIQHRQTQIFHKIHLPNGSHANVEVESWSVAKELCERIASTIGLQSAFGLFLFVKVGEKVVCIPPEEHFFDFIHQLQKWARKTLLRQNGDAQQNEQFAYKVHFMRKVWLDVVPGQDLRQDLIFHYYQELPKYLRGYHAIGKKDAAQIGALILRAQTKDGKQPPLTHLQHILHQLIPKDFLKAHSSAEWKRVIGAGGGK
uniref:Myosin motor domain-containing protein n=1 Tax=Globodera pallida TaxID=36090 RepID=A0A183C4P7_GLOPA